MKRGAYMRARKMAPVLAAAALVLGGCGSSGSATTGSTAGASGSTAAGTSARLKRKARKIALRIDDDNRPVGQTKKVFVK